MAVTFIGGVQVPIVFGNDATTQNLLAIENQVGSRVDVHVRRLTIQMDPITALTSVMPQVKVARATSISGGVLLDKSKFNTSQTSDPFVVIRSAMGEGCAITASAGTTIWQQYVSRLHTAVEQVLGTDENLLPYLVATQEFVLHPGESLLAYMVGSAVSSNPALGNNWQASVILEENSLSTFAVNGQVTLSASGVEGAKVIVLEADDAVMTNPVLVGVETTDSGGNWASTITAGKVGAAFVQYKSGATLYTAPASPFLES